MFSFFKDWNTESKDFSPTLLPTVTISGITYNDYDYEEDVELPPLEPIGPGYGGYRNDEIRTLIGKHISLGRWTYFEDAIKIHSAMQIEKGEVQCTLRSAMRTNALYCLRVIDSETKE